MLAGGFMYGFFEVGKKIRYYRTKRGYSKRAFAELTGMSFTRLDEIESGAAVYQFKTLEKIASALEIDLPELLDFD